MLALVEVLVNLDEHTEMASNILLRVTVIDILPPHRTRHDVVPEPTKAPEKPTTPVLQLPEKTPVVVLARRRHRLQVGPRRVLQQRVPYGISLQLSFRSLYVGHRIDAGGDAGNKSLKLV